MTGVSEFSDNGHGVKLRTLVSEILTEENGGGPGWPLSRGRMLLNKKKTEKPNGGKKSMRRIPRKGQYCSFPWGKQILHANVKRAHIYSRRFGDDTGWIP